MDYHALNQLRNEHNQRTDQWLDSLGRAAHLLGNALQEKLNPPAPWERDGKKNPYIRVIEVPERGAEPVILRPSAFRADADGMFAFAVAVTFEPAPNAFPKSAIWIAVGAKAFEGEIKYILLDPDTKTPQKSSEWTGTPEATADNLIQCFVRHFSFDPATDFAKRPKIGFFG